MSEDSQSEARMVILDATGRAHLEDALAWLAEGHPMEEGTDWRSLLGAVVEVMGDDEVSSAALRRVSREATQSEVDTSRVLFAATGIPSSERIGEALDSLLSRTSNGSFAELSPREILSAQREDPLAIEVLCLAVGIAYNDAKEWFGPSGEDWNREQVTNMLNYLEDLVQGRVVAPIPGSTPARAIEFLESEEGGWSVADYLRREHVPYELLLAQRYVGSSWLQHKNKTSRYPSIAAAKLLCEALSDRGIDYRLSSILEGSSRPGDLQELTGIYDKRIGCVTISQGHPTFAVAFSAARDGGTARANGDGLLQIPRSSVPVAVVLTGPGWSQRPETDRLAQRFRGLIFTEQTIWQLVDQIEREGS